MFSRGILAKLRSGYLALADHLLKVGERVIKADVIHFAQFTNPDGTLKGGIDVEVSNPQETQVVPVGGQRAMLPEKKRKAKWY